MTSSHGLSVSHRVTIIVAVLLAMLIASLSLRPVRAHGEADRIMRGAYSAPNGQDCCGVNDCHRLPAQAVSYGGGIFIVKWAGAEHSVPEQEAKASKDQSYCLCETPKQKPRCFFRPPMGA